MALLPGTRLGPYEITSALGAGGMGEVYRARDSALKRDVAIKVLPADWSRDPDRLQRFELEAQAAAALNHPNIVSVFQVGQHDGIPFIVTELLQGEALRDRLNRGPMCLAEVLKLGTEIAQGLGAAHAAGIVHRDLKPENVYLTKDGRIKILDFGLAKLAPAQTPAADSATVTYRAPTIPGQVMGTIGYMSPEQVRGEAADARSDVFALGAILYEMAMGLRAFKKPTPAETMVAILNEEPAPASELSSTVPPGLQRVINRCLMKNPEQRFQHASDIAFALEALNEASSLRLPSVAAESTASRTWTRQPLWFAGTLLLAIVGVLLYQLRHPRAPTVSIESIIQLTDDGQPKGVHNSLQTDGSRLYFNEGRYETLQIAQVAVTGGPVAIIPTTVPEAKPVDITPEGTALLVLQGGSGPPPKPLWEVPLPVGEARRLANLEGQDGSITPDGHILFPNLHDLYIAEKDASNSRKLFSFPDRLIADPYVSPDGKHIVFTRYPESEIPPQLYLVNNDGSGLHALVTSGDPGGFCCGRWTPDGHYIVFETRGVRQDLWYLKVDHRWPQPANQPERLTAGPISYFDPVPSRDGKQIFAIGTRQRGQVVRYDIPSKQFVPYVSGISATNLSFSRDGEWVAYLSFPEHILWRSRKDGTDRLQLASGFVASASISPDGQRVLYETGDGNVYFIGINGGRAQAILNDAQIAHAAWSPDGNSLVFFSRGAGWGATLLDLRTGKRTAVPGSDGVSGPLWMVGDKLVGIRDSAFVVFDPNTQTWSQLHKPASSRITKWGVARYQPYLYYVLGGTSPELIRVQIPDGKAESVTNLRDFPFASYGQVHLADTQISIAADGSPLFTRDTGSQEIYALTVKWP